MLVSNRQDRWLFINSRECWLIYTMNCKQTFKGDLREDSISRKGM